MQRPLKIILFVIIGLLVGNFIVSFWGNSRISDIQKNLETAKLSADSALNELKFSKSRLDSIRSDIDTFRTNVSTIQESVETNDFEKRVQEQKDIARLTGLKNTIKDLRPELQPLDLPDIQVKNLEK
jgi:hypothetical protein